MDLKNLASLSFFWPELILFGTIILISMFDLLLRNGRALA